ncbi:MAG: FAD-binding oxidoreductase [Acidobacteriota bacterium]|nr:FAD-binding oxidoreductase [Acidobacteriota bacterium]
MATTMSPGALEADALEQLRGEFRGEIVEPTDDGYDDLRGVFNGMFDKRPRVILRPAGAADVIRGIGLARTSGLPLAVRSGGHSVAGFSSVDGGIVLDLRLLKAVRVDPNGKTVRAQGGVNWGELDHETQAFGLAVTGGRVTTTGVVGFTTGTGSGWLERKFGFAADNVIGADVVTADGQIVHASETENEELLWGLKGGGGNFGVVTEIEFTLGALSPIVYGGLAAFHPGKAAELARLWRDLSHENDDIGWAIASITAPPAPFVPEEWHGRRVPAVAGMIAGPHDQAEKILAPFRALGPIVDLWQPMPYTMVQALLDPGNPYGRQNYWRARNLTDLPDAAIDVWLEAAETAPSPFTAVIMLNGGGAIGKVGEDDTAISGRTSPFNFHLNGMWEDPNATDENIAWVRRVSEALAPHVAEGISLNFQTEIADDVLRESFGAKKVERLRKLKDRYDPTNVFRLNQNIAPSAG